MACLGSYWALMTAMYALGSWNLLWMAGLTALMMLEQVNSGGNGGHLAAVAAGILLTGVGLLAAVF